MNRRHCTRVSGVILRNLVRKSLNLAAPRLRFPIACLGRGFLAAKLPIFPLGQLFGKGLLIVINRIKSRARVIRYCDRRGLRNRLGLLSGLMGL
jgi:hypothetical protein